jgi:hypothetical protein
VACIISNAQKKKGEKRKKGVVLCGLKKTTGGAQVAHAKQKGV